MLMSADDYRESLRRSKPTVYVDGERIGSVADAPQLAPGVAAVAKTYELALAADLAPVMQARSPESGGPANRMIALTRDTADLLNRLEAVRRVCQETGCAQRYLGGDALNALHYGPHRADAEQHQVEGAGLRVRSDGGFDQGPEEAQLIIQAARAKKQANVAAAAAGRG